MDRIFIIAGEPSGDLHGSNLVKSLLEQKKEIEIQCWGGDKMERAGARVMKHVDDLAFMGFIEVVANLGKILSNFKLCRKQIEAFNPDLVVLIDYPGFNLRMAKTIFNMDIPVHYYISPQIWAWKESRVIKIKKYISQVYCILPFEKDFYAKHGVESEFVGHPLLDEFRQTTWNTQEFLDSNQISKESRIIAVLPGSRTQEIGLILPIIKELKSAFPEHEIIISKVHWQNESAYTKVLGSDFKLIEGDTYNLLAAAECAVVTSGTATLETALIGTPQVVVYKANALSVLIARWLVKIKYISLVNLIMDKAVVTELIQSDANSKNLISELKLIVKNGKNRDVIQEDYLQLKSKLGSINTSDFVANKLLKSMHD